MKRATHDDIVELIAFPGAPNLPIFVAADRGRFAAHGAPVSLTTTPSSTYQVERLVAGEYHVAATAFDNVVAYREGQGAVAFDPPPDLFVFMGATQVELALVVAPDVDTYADLRGRSLALDALATGFAFVLRHLLEANGLSAGECEMVPVGATPQRWESVRDAKHAGTLTIEPFTSIALARGFRVLDTSTRALPHYQGGVFAASRAWAHANEASLIGFIRGYLDGLAWTLDPANRDAARQTLLDNMAAIRPGVVDPVLDKLLSARTGLTPGARLDPDGMRTVLELRSRYAEPARKLDDPGAYVDLAYFERATRVEP